MSRIKCMSILIVVMILCLIFSGCPNDLDSEGMRTGKFYKDAIELQFSEGYGVSFYERNKEVKITYEFPEGKIKNAIFILDGYDPDKKIGYKVITDQEIAEWKKDITEGNIIVPDTNDIKLIQMAALKYKFPIILLCVNKYQNKINATNASYIQDMFLQDYKLLIDSKEIKGWAQNGLYDGTWIKEGLEKILSESYGINFSHNDLPFVDIKYNGDGAVFQLDGYDTKRQIGYKFVTAEDIKAWATKRAQGNFKVPTINDSNQIKTAALDYMFPVLFIYVPEYWSTDIASIFNQELSEPLNMNEHIKQWLKEHK